MTSPSFTFKDAFAVFPFTSTLPASQASFATVRLLINRETFKNLSSLMNLSVQGILQNFSCFELGSF